ncbi:hypothetical protein UFOVP1444_33 [uncultured Caudovirales phage]|uniref:Terminase-like family n=1 Tax=uncultured Caudovirales phage TaxID=2100421 RepID=A0A6J7XAY4_9CAUD|nr:hypothetical protein UFOVP1444_33 [uncultured Caudovirales phage]CAB5227957.1 hypothetical protein UFOVP1536_21 [uncultured Caudovirales phage]
MPDVELPHRFVPRPYQKLLYEHFIPEQEKKRAFVLAHRRWGKDLAALNIAIVASQLRKGTFWHLLPYAKQARAVVWNGIDTNNDIKIMDHIPAELIDRKNENDMRVHLKNGSIWQCIGGDDIDRHVGTNPIGVVLSEYAIMDPAVWAYLRPILRENKGWSLMITTVRGKNHAWQLAQKYAEMQEKNPNYLYLNQTIDDTGALSKADVEEERASGMSDAMIRQEYYNDPEIPLQGAYYITEITKAQKDGRITNVTYEPKATVNTAWDIGFSDFTVIIFFQIVAQEIRIIDYYSASGEEMSHYARVLKEKDYVYESHFGPWDVEIKHLAAGGKSVWDVARSLGIKFRVTPQPKSKLDGIEQVRNIFPRLWIDKTKCSRLIEALSSYRKELLPEKLQQTGVGQDMLIYKDTPLHDWTSHFADCMRVLAWNIQKSFRKVELPQRQKDTVSYL